MRKTLDVKKKVSKKNDGYDFFCEVHISEKNYVYTIFLNVESTIF